MKQPLLTPGQRKRLREAAKASVYLENFRLSTLQKHLAGVPAPSPNKRKFAAALDALKRA